MSMTRDADRTPPESGPGTRTRTLAGKLQFFAELLPHKYRDSFINLVIDVAEVDKLAEDSGPAWGVLRQVAHAAEAADLPTHYPDPSLTGVPATLLDVPEPHRVIAAAHLPTTALLAAFRLWRRRQPTAPFACEPACTPPEVAIQQETPVAKAPEPTAAEKAIVPLDKLRTMLDGPALVEIKKALPPAMRGNERRMARTLVTALQGNPFLQTCTGLSLVGAVIQSSQLGLEVGGPLGQAYLVPYWNAKLQANQAQLQIGYRGLINLAHRTGQVKALFAHEVREKDEFRFRLGSDPKVVHVPAAGDRGPVTHFYAVLRATNGGVDVEVATKADIDAHRKRYVKPPKFGQSPWDTNYEEMAKKTLIRRLAKRCPLSVEFTRAAVLDEYGEQEVEQNLTAVGAEAMARLEEQGEVVEGEVVPGDGAGDDGDPMDD